MKSKSRTEQPDKNDNKIGGTPPWNEAVFRELADDIIDGVYCINADGYFTFVNKTITDRYGISPDKFYASHFLDVVNPRYHDIVSKNFQRVINGERGMPYEVRHEDADGQLRILEVLSRPIRIDGKVLGILGISRDITERKLAEEKLRRSEEKYRVLLEKASDAILLADTQGNIIEANRKAEELLGYTKDELLQMHYTQLHPMREVERTIAAFKEIIEKNTGHLSNGYIERKDGDIVPVDITSNVIEYAGRKVVRGSFRDISEHKEARDILEKMVKERTVELSRNNEQLKLEIKERKRAEAAMRRKGRELKLYAKKLEDLNTALRVLLKRREEDKSELEEKIVSNVKEIVEPYVKKLKKTQLNADQSAYVNIIETNLNSIISPFLRNLISKHPNLTSREIQITYLIKAGKITKEIMDIMDSSKGAIDFHRNNIRAKLGLKNKKSSLRSYLLSMT